MSQQNQCKVLLADDHILLRDSLAVLINSFDECRVIAVAGNGLEVQKKIEEGNVPDLVLLDLNMPEMDGYETARWLQEKHPEIKIIT